MRHFTASVSDKGGCRLMSAIIPITTACKCACCMRMCVCVCVLCVCICFGFHIIVY